LTDFPVLPDEIIHSLKLRISTEGRPGESRKTTTSNNNKKSTEMKIKEIKEKISRMGKSCDVV